MFEGDLECRTDVWGLGCLMFEMATGLPLFYSIRHQTRERLRTAVSISITSKNHPIYDISCRFSYLRSD